MGMSTDVIIGHFLKAEDDISTIVHSDKLVDTVIDSGDGYYFSNHFNTVFHWSNGDKEEKIVEISEKVKAEKLEAFKKEIEKIITVLDVLGIKWQIIYGAKAWYN